MTPLSRDLLRKYTQQNRRAWNEIAVVRSQGFPAGEYFASGKLFLDQQVIQAAQDSVGSLERSSVIHLQCATGEETISWSILGANALGVDIAEEEIAIARQKAQEAGTSTQFVSADIYDLPESLPPGLPSAYDLVYTGGGAIVWLPDLKRWAQIVAGLLRPGGHLLLMDEHPLSFCLWVEGGQLQIVSDYFGRSSPEEVAGWSHFQGGENAQEIKYEFSWPLGDILTALAQAGLILERLEEFPGGPAWRYAELQESSRQLPGSFLLLARKI